MFFEIKASERPALITEDGRRLTYGDLSQRIAELSARLTGRDLAFCLCENSPESVTAYLSCLNSRVVPLLLDRKIDSELLENLLSVYSPNLLFVPSGMKDVFPAYGESFTFGCYSLLKANNPVPHELYPDLALLLTTSGSTGSPKLVRQSYVNIQANAESIAQYLELDETERPVTTLPMNYTYGLSIINSHFLVGACVLQTDSPMTMKRFWDFAKTERATSFGGVPFTYEMLKKIRFFKMDLPDLKYMTQAGGKLSPELHREFAEWAVEKGKKFIVMYGQTEATARMGWLPADKSLEKYGSMGKAIPGGKFTLIDVNGNPVEESDVGGELVYEGALGYAQELSDLSLGDERHGVLITGDMAKRDADGYYYIVGRKKRFLKIFGNRVNLDEIDRLIKTAYEGIDCASTGVDDHMKTFITDSSLTDEVRRWLTDKTHLSETAFEVLYIPEIPKNEAGKTLYKELPQ